MSPHAFENREQGIKLSKVASASGLSFLLFLSQTASILGNPTGPTVVAGSATIGSAGPTLTINQSSNQAIINWQQFSIANGETTKFIVPSSLSATLNRVTGGNPSLIYGSLQSNGIVYLVNPSGIVVGPSGRIDTAGFLASTLDVSNQQFLAGGNLEFAGSSNASVDNEGTMHASDGDVYLIANQVTNGGTLSAPHGTVGLAAGSDILFQQGGNQHLFVEATPAGTTRALGVTNTGTIRAAAAELKAAGGNAYALAINNSGTIAATGFKKVNGQVYLTSDGGDITNSGQISAKISTGNGGTIVLNGHGTSSKGTVLNSGSLVASGTGAGKKGGTVQVLGNQVGITDHGSVDVSGDAGGGTALIGGDEHGSNAAIPDADQTYLGPDATINADALTLGTGGKVILWGNETTQVYGQISATGGAQSGNGGFVETSAAVLDARTAPNLAAPHGTGGTWLLDPSDVTISDTVSDSNFSASFALTGNPVTISQTTLQNALENGSVMIDASTGTGGSGTINWTQTSNDPMTVVNPGGNTLTLNAPVLLTMTGVTVNATGTGGLNIVMNSGENAAGATETVGAVNIQGSSLTLNGGSFSATGNGYTSTTDENGEANGVNLFNTNINAGGGDISLTGTAGFTSPDGGESLNAGLGVAIGSDGTTPVSLNTTGTGNITITGTFDQSPTVSSFLSAVDIYQDGSGTNINQLSVVNGTINILGTVFQGTSDGSIANASTIEGIDIEAGSKLQATGSGGIILDGDTSASISQVSGGNASYNEGVQIRGTLSVAGGTVSITGTSGTVDTTNSFLTGSSNVPLSIGVFIADGGQVNSTGPATIGIFGTSGNVTTGSSFTGGSIGVLVDGGASLNLAAGTSFSLTGQAGEVNAGDGTNGGDAQSDGVDIGSSTGLATNITMAAGMATGSITITGTGGSIDLTSVSTGSTTPTGNPIAEGIALDGGASIVANNAANILLNGTGGTITGGVGYASDATGVLVHADSAGNTSISSNTGNVSIVGMGGDDVTTVDGIRVDSSDGGSASITSTAGNISLLGSNPNITFVQSLSANGNGNAAGVDIGGDTTAAAVITASAGSILIDGTVTSGTDNTREAGVFIGQNSQITAMGTGGATGATAQGDITILGSTVNSDDASAGVSQSLNGGVFIEGANTVVNASGILADAAGFTGLTIKGTSNTIDGSTGATIDQDDGGGGGLALEPMTVGIGVINGATIETTGSTSPMTLIGVGGTNANTLNSDNGYADPTTGATSASYGVAVFSPITSQTTSVTSGGSMTITGTAGESPTTGIGVMIGGPSNAGYASVTSGGAVTIVGTGGEVTGENEGVVPNSGVGIFNPGNIIDGQNGNPISGGQAAVAANGSVLSITGTAGAGGSTGVDMSYYDSGNNNDSYDPVLTTSSHLSVIATTGRINSYASWNSPGTLFSTSAGTSSNIANPGSSPTAPLSLSGGDFTVTQDFGAVQYGVVNVTSLTIDGSSDTDATNLAAINASTLTVNTEGPINLNGAISVGGAITIATTGGNITLGPNGTVTGSGQGANVILAAGTNLANSGYIINNSTATTPIQANGSNFYLYSADPTNDSFGTITVQPVNMVYGATYPGSSLPAVNEELFYVASSSDVGPNAPSGGSGSMGGSGGSGGSSSTGSTPPPSTMTGGAAGGGSNLVPPAASPQPPPQAPPNPGTLNLGGLPPPLPIASAGPGSVAPNPGQGDSPTANVVGPTDDLSMGPDGINNVGNPAASGALNQALGPPVFHNLQDALQQLGDFTAADLPDTANSGGAGGDGGGPETILTGGDVVVMTPDGPKKLKPGQIPPQLQQALGNNVLSGMPGH